MSAITKDQLIILVQRTASANGGRPLGQRAFFDEHSLTKKSLLDIGIRSYGDLCELSGFSRNRLTQRMGPDQLFEPLAKLTVVLGRFPDYTDREIARRKDSTFPGYGAFRTAQDEKGSLAHQLLEWCSLSPQHSEALRILNDHIAKLNGEPSKLRRRVRVVNGYVYLMRYGGRGRKYKIGRSDDPPRRHSNIAGMVPDDLILVHVIETDDPVGIERYWHQRFEAKRVANKKEIFRLDREDVVAFKSRKYQ